MHIPCHHSPGDGHLFLPAGEKAGLLAKHTQPAGLGRSPFLGLCPWPLLSVAPDSYTGDFLCKPATHTPTTNWEESWTWCGEWQGAGAPSLQPTQGTVLLRPCRLPGESLPGKEGEVLALRMLALLSSPGLLAWPRVTTRDSSKQEGVCLWDKK